MPFSMSMKPASTIFGSSTQASSSTRALKTNVICFKTKHFISNSRIYF